MTKRIVAQTAEQRNRTSELRAFDYDDDEFDFDNYDDDGFDFDVDFEDFEEFEEYFSVSTCPRQCVVELDGHCPHGYPSRAMAAGFV